MKSIKRTTILKSTITGLAILVIVSRFLWPTLSIDSITLGLLVIAVLPWLADVIKSAEFPGGWKIEFQDIVDASDRATEGVEGAAPEHAGPPHSFLNVASQDANLALVGLRIEIERRLRALAEQSDLKHQSTLSGLIRQLSKNGTISVTSASGLHELVEAGNRAAHGAEVDERVALWALDYGPQILASLQTSLIPNEE